MIVVALSNFKHLGLIPSDSFLLSFFLRTNKRMVTTFWILESFASKKILVRIYSVYIQHDVFDIHASQVEKRGPF